MKVKNFTTHFTQSNQKLNRSLPARLLVIVLLTVFAGEAIVMSLVFALPGLSIVQIVIVDALILVVLLIPPLYVLLFLPLQREITSRKSDQDRLSVLNEMFERLFSSTHIQLAYMDVNFNFVRVNSAYAEAGNKTPDYFVGRNYFELFLSAENEHIFKRVVETGEAFFSYSKPLEFKDTPEGEPSYWDWSLVSLKNECGKVDGVLLSQVDVTARMQAETQMHQKSLELAFLNAISVAASSSLDLDAMLTSLRDLFADHTAFLGGCIYTYDSVSKTLVLKIFWGEGGEQRQVGHRVSISSVPYDRILTIKNIRQIVPQNVERDTTLSDWVDRLPHGWVACVLIPLIADGELIGMMELVRNESTCLSRRPEEFYRAVGSIIGISMHNSHLYTREQTSYRKAEILRQAGIALTQSLELKTVMQAMFKFMSCLVPYDRASVMLIEDEKQLFIYSALVSQTEQQYREVDRLTFEKDENPYIRTILMEKKGMWLADVDGCEVWKSPLLDNHTRSWLGVPFFAGDNVIGVCSLEKAQPDYFSAEHLELAEALASQVGVAVQNAWLFTQLRAGRERLQALSRQLVEVQENERSYIARELHDQAGQMLTSLKVGLRLMERDAKHSPALMAGISQLKNLVDQILNDLYRLVKNLRPASLDQLGLVGALKHYAQQVSYESGVTVQFEALGIDQRFPKNVEINIYRIIQEALTNALRHAQASWISIVIEKRENTVVAVIEDNGIGFDPVVANNTDRLGLFGIRERAEMLGGKLLIESEVQQGTAIYLEVPDDDTHFDR